MAPDTTTTTHPSTSEGPEPHRRRTTSALVAFADGLRARPTARTLVLNEVVKLNTGVAESVAARYRRRGVETADLNQAAYEGLVKAVERFDPTQAEDLLTFAVPTIRGEVQRHFRDRTWSVRPPRAMQELAMRARRESDRLLQSLGREATLLELADALGIALSTCAEAVNTHGAYGALSLDRPLGDRDDGDGDGGRTLGSMLTADDQIARADDQAILRPALAGLSDRDRLLVHLRFDEELTQREIGEQLGLTQTHVSRLLNRALARLRDSLGEDARPAPAA
jgi:RNA polymerase sigma-B factor